MDLSLSGFVRFPEALPGPLQLGVSDPGLGEGLGAGSRDPHSEPAAFGAVTGL